MFNFNAWVDRVLACNHPLNSPLYRGGILLKDAYCRVPSLFLSDVNVNQHINTVISMLCRSLCTRVLTNMSSFSATPQSHPCCVSRLRLPLLSPQINWTIESCQSTHKYCMASTLCRSLCTCGILTHMALLHGHAPVSAVWLAPHTGPAAKAITRCLPVYHTAAATDQHW